jgi:HEAT repeat protein
MKGKILFFLGVIFMLMACRSYDISSLIIQDDLKRQIAAGNLRIRIDKGEVPFVVDLLLDEDPLIRFAALKIMENNRWEDFLFPLLETTLDEDSRVSAEAFRILEAYPDWTMTFLEENLSQTGDLLCLNSLHVLEKFDSPSTINAMVDLFSSESERKKNGAAQSLSKLTTLNGNLMTSLKESDEDYLRAGYYRIIAHYGESTLIPLLFEGINDSSNNVWGACISGIYSFGEEALPYVDRQIKSNDYLMQLSCLQILEVIKSEQSLPLLLSFYSNPNQLLAQKAAIIVKSYGEAAVPSLIEILPSENNMTDRLALWSLREINSLQALPLYLDLMDLNDPALTPDVLLALNALGKDIYPALQRHMETADPAVAVTLLRFLIERGDLSITESDTCSYYLITGIRESLFESFLDIKEIGREIAVDFRALREALAYGDTLRKVSQGDNLYFSLYREAGNLRNRAENNLQESLRLRREYLKTKDQTLLEKSSDLFKLYEADTSLVREKEKEMTNLPETVQKSGEKLIFDYLKARRTVVDIWLGISPRYRSLADLVYQDLNVDINELIQEVSRE